MGRTAALIFSFILIASAFAQETVIEATTGNGEKVRLLSNGRWEYADPRKAEPQRQAREAEAAAERERARNAQGGWFGFGRTIEPGDKDYNRGSLSPGRR